VTSANGVTIRAVQAGDAAAVADLVRLGFSAQPRPTNPPSSALKETAATIIEHLTRGGGAVLESGGVIAGLVLWNEDEAPSTSAGSRSIPSAVDRACPGAHGRSEREARRQGFSRMTLGVRLELEENRRFFRSADS